VCAVVADPAALPRARELASRAAELFPVRVVRRFVEHGGGSQAILIAWHVLTATFPMALAVAAVGALVLSVAGISAGTIAGQVVALFPTDTGAQEAALQGVDALRRQTLLFAILALLGFLWTGAGLFGAMDEAFAAVFRTPVRSFARQKLMSLAMMGLFAAMALLAVGTSALVPLLRDIPSLPVSLSNGPAGAVLQACVGVVSGFVLFYVIYFVVPNRRQRPSRVLPGAAFAGVAFEVLSQLWPAYIKLNAGVNRYGSQFAFLFILLAFSYLLGVITILGADVIAVLDPGAPSPSDPERPPEPSPG
jgi:membrane protein